MVADDPDFEGLPSEHEALLLEARRNSKLPPYVRRIAGGYELKYFWFELFEMMRKLALVGISVVFPPGGLAQASYGLLVGFIVFGRTR